MSIEQMFRMVRHYQQRYTWTYVWRGRRRFVSESGPMVACACDGEGHGQREPSNG